MGNLEDNKQVIKSTIKNYEANIRALNSTLDRLEKATQLLDPTSLMKVFIEYLGINSNGEIIFDECYYANEKDVNNFAVAIGKLYNLAYTPNVIISQI